MLKSAYKVICDFCGCELGFTDNKKKVINEDGNHGSTRGSFITKRGHHFCCDNHAFRFELGEKYKKKESPSYWGNI